MCVLLFIVCLCKKNQKVELIFSFCPEEEFRSTYLNPLLSQWTLHRPMKPSPPAKGPVPSSWDWRDHGAVSSVKDQVPIELIILHHPKFYLLPTSCCVLCVSVCVSCRECVDPAGHFLLQAILKASGSWKMEICCHFLNKVTKTCAQTQTNTDHKIIQ